MLPTRQLYKSILLFIITVVLSGGAGFYATLYPSAWILMWFAIFPITLYALKRTCFETFFAGFLAFLIGNFAEPFVYFHTLLPLSATLYGAILDAFVYTILLLLFRFVALRSQHWLSGLVFASGWVAYNFISSLYAGGATYSNIAYTQLLNLPILQLAAITGIWGITFLLIFCPASIALAWHYKNIAGFKLKVLLLPLLLLFATVSFGMYRLSFPIANNELRVAMVSPRALHIDLNNVTPETERANFVVINGVIKDIESLAKSKVDVILLPEVIAFVPQHDSKHILQLLSNTARNNNVTLILGLITKENSKAYNSAYIFAPSGKVLLRHDKWHLVPGFESREYVPGNTISILKTEKQGDWGLLICRDMDYEQPARQYGKQGVNIMFVPGWDFDYDAWMHGRYAHMRAVENGYAVARAGRAGFLMLIDSRGHIVNLVPALSWQKKKNALISTVTLGTGKTFYSKHGDWFAWLNCILFVLSILLLLKYRK
jgi:apolipoprotein N-acyltransferase